MKTTPLPMRILLVEDDDGFVALFSRFLRPYSSEIVRTKRLDDAWHKANERQFDVLLVDLWLDDATKDQTLEMLPELRRLQPGAAIIVVSGDLSMTEDEAHRFGADVYLPKEKMSLDRNSRALFSAIVTAVIPKPHVNRMPSFEEHVRMMETLT